MITERDKGYAIYFGDTFQDVAVSPYVGGVEVVSACWGAVKDNVPEFLDLEWELLFIPMEGNAYEVRAGRVFEKMKPPVPTGIYVQQRAFGLD